MVSDISFASQFSRYVSRHTFTISQKFHDMFHDTFVCPGLDGYDMFHDMFVQKSGLRRAQGHPTEALTQGTKNGRYQKSNDTSSCCDLSRKWREGALPV